MKLLKSDWGQQTTKDAEEFFVGSLIEFFKDFIMKERN